MGLISKFVSSKFSGYALIALLIAAAGAGYWFWGELKEFGGLEEKSAAQAREISSLENQVSYLDGQNDLKQEIGSLLSKTTQQIDRRYESMRLDMQEALKDASQEYLDCRAMVVPERLRYPDRNANSEDQTKPGDDG